MYKILYIFHRVIKDYLAICDEDMNHFIAFVVSSGGKIVDVKPIYN